MFDGDDGLKTFMNRREKLWEKWEVPTSIWWVILVFGKTTTAVIQQQGKEGSSHISSSIPVTVFVCFNTKQMHSCIDKKKKDRFSY